MTERTNCDDDENLKVQEYHLTEDVLYVLKLKVRDVVDGVDETENEIWARQTHNEIIARLTQLWVSHHGPASARSFRNEVQKTHTITHWHAHRN